MQPVAAVAPYTGNLMHAFSLFLLRILAIVSLIFVAVSCDNSAPETTGTFEINFVVRPGGQSFVPGAAQTNLIGQRYSLDVFKLYLSDLRLVRMDGTEEPLSDTELFDFVKEYGGKTTHGEGAYRQYAVPPGNYKGLRFGIGVPQNRNHLDPNQYADSHLLSTKQGMHWSTGSGYLFLKLEGSMDSTRSQKGSLNHGFQYHTGLDTLYRTMDYTLDEHNFTVEANGELQFVFDLDINRLFYNSTDTINMVTQNITHVTPVGSAAFQLSEKITNNLTGNALFKNPF